MGHGMGLAPPSIEMAVGQRNQATPAPALVGVSCRPGSAWARWQPARSGSGRGSRGRRRGRLRTMSSSSCRCRAGGACGSARRPSMRCCIGSTASRYEEQSTIRRFENSIILCLRVILYRPRALAHTRDGERQIQKDSLRLASPQLTHMMRFSQPSCRMDGGCWRCCNVATGSCTPAATHTSLTACAAKWNSVGVGIVRRAASLGRVRWPSVTSVTSGRFTSERR